MLILSRKEDQKIRIGNDIVLKVISISENNVKLGIEADINVKIYREEVYNSIKEHSRKATSNVKEVLPANIRNLKINKIKNNAEKK